jgi:hypothetical protein
MANFYQKQIDTLNKAVELLSKQKKVSSTQQKEWDSLNKNPDVVTKYSKLLNYYNSQNWPDVQQVLKDYLATEQGQVWNLPPDKQKELLAKYNNALYFLKQKGELDKAQSQELIDINQNKNSTLADRLVNIIRFYKKHKFPNVDQVYFDYQQSIKQQQQQASSEKDNLEYLASKGLDSAKLPEKQINLLLSYIRFLEKITGKNIAFK